MRAAAGGVGVYLVSRPTPSNLFLLGWTDVSLMGCGFLRIRPSVWQIRWAGACVHARTWFAAILYLNTFRNWLDGWTAVVLISVGVGLRRPWGVGFWLDGFYY
jgi:hypothetical protein